MKKILCINTGGTFNKRYDPTSGTLEVDSDHKAPNEISKKWQNRLTIVSIIGKDSLDITSSDRELLLKTIKLSRYHQDIIVIHGTDTMKITAAYLANAKLDKRVVLTGSMLPYSIDPVEATANFATAYGYLQALEQNGVYISMNGIVAPYQKLTKDRAAGKFVISKKR